MLDPKSKAITITHMWIHIQIDNYYVFYRITTSLVVKYAGGDKGA